MKHRKGCTMHDAEHSTEENKAQDCDTAENPLPESQQFEEEIEVQKKAFAELNDQLLRLAADYENFKKRTLRERETLISQANERFAIDILSLIHISEPTRRTPISY